MSTPNPGFRVALMLLVIVGVAVAAFLAGESRHSVAMSPQAASKVWTPLVVTPEGNQMVQPNTRRMEFWTPSSKTKDFLARENGNIHDRDKWEAIQTEDRVIEFGKALRSDPGVLGYRRYEVWGHGRTVPKPGWWWAMTVSTNYSVERFVGVYRGFWKSSNAVFVEVIDNRGLEEHGGPRTQLKE